LGKYEAMEARPSLADCVRSAREKMIVSRLHYTSTVKTLGGLHEDFRYLFTGVSGGRYIPLLWRDRTVQTNMTVTDREDRNIPYLPSAVVDQFCEEYLRQLWNEFDLSLAGAPAPSWINEARPRSIRLTSFDYDPGDTMLAQQEWALHASDFPDNAAFVRLKSFIDHLTENYLPVAAIPESSEEFLFLHHGVDVSTSTRDRFRHSMQAETGYSTWDRLIFALTGRIRFDTPIFIDAFIHPPWKLTESLHVRVMLPEGMMVASPIELMPRRLFAETRVLQLTEITGEYVYSYIGKDDASRFVRRLTAEEDQAKALKAEIDRSSKVIQELADLASAYRRSGGTASPPATKPRQLTLQDVATTYGTMFKVFKQTRELRRQKRLLEMGRSPTLRIQLGLRGTMKTLLALLWVVIVCTVAVDVLGLLGVDAYLALLGSLLLVVLTLAVFSVDKPLLRVPFFGHTALSTAVFLTVPVVPLLVRMLPLLVRILSRLA
jgi:hypothetical protein